MPVTKNVLELMSEMLQEQDNYSICCANNLNEKATPPPPIEIEQDALKENDAAESKYQQNNNSGKNSITNVNTNLNGNFSNTKNTNSGKNEMTGRYSDRYGDRYADRYSDKVSSYELIKIYICYVTLSAKNI